MRGVEAAIAHVLLVAVVIAVSLAVVSWVVSTMGSVQSSRAQLIIYPDSYIDVNDVDFAGRSAVSLHLHIAMKSGDTTRVDHIEVIETGARVTYFYLLDNDASLRDAYRLSRGVVYSQLPGGWEGWLIASLYVRSPVSGDAGPYTAGSMYTVRLYLKDGSFYEVIVPAKS